MGVSLDLFIKIDWLLLKDSQTLNVNHEITTSN